MDAAGDEVWELLMPPSISRRSRIGTSGRHIFGFSHILDGVIDFHQLHCTNTSGNLQPITKW